MTAESGNPMQGINSYGRELTADSIRSGEHRNFIGGMWDEIGVLQFNFLRQHGLQPQHRLLDIGCGCLRGGLHFIDYLDQGNYAGLDINRSLIEAAHQEVANAGLQHKQPQLLVDEAFQLHRFEASFDYMLSISLFTHLPMNIIIRCLSQVAASLPSHGVYFTTFFQAPNAAHIDPIAHQPGGITTHFDADPFHYSLQEMTWMANQTGLQATLVDDFKHPRNQRMLAFRPA